MPTRAEATSNTNQETTTTTTAGETTMPTRANETAATGAYQRGQAAANKHQQAARAFRAVARAKTDKSRATRQQTADAATAAAAAADLAFVQPDDHSNDALLAAHSERAAALFARKQSRVLASYRAGYKDTTSASGSKSKNNGDAVALALAGVGAGAVVRAAEALLDLDPGSLAEKYSALNEGQKRMNSGNRIRNGEKKGRFSVDQIKAAIKAATKQ